MKLTDYLHRERLTASAFAERIAVPPSTITRLLAKQRSPRLDLLEKVLAGTNGDVTPNDFVDCLAMAQGGGQ